MSPQVPAGRVGVGNIWLEASTETRLESDWSSVSFYWALIGSYSAAKLVFQYYLWFWLQKKKTASHAVARSPGNITFAARWFLARCARFQNRIGGCVELTRLEEGFLYLNSGGPLSAAQIVHKDIFDWTKKTRKSFYMCILNKIKNVRKYFRFYLGI